MSAPGLFDDPEEEPEGDASPPHSREGSSEDAAWSMKPSAGDLRTRVLTAIVKAGQKGMTCDEVEQALAMKHQTASARIWELQGNPRRSNRPALVESDGERRRTCSGRTAIVWRASAQAADALKGA